METSIRFVRIGGRPLKTALCFRGRRHAHVVINDETRIRSCEISLKEHDLSFPVMFKAGAYPIPKIVEHYREMGARKQITRRADYFLTRALNGGVDEETALPPDTVENEPEAPTASPGTPKPVKAASERQPSSGGPSRTAGAAVIARIAVELKLEPTKLRKLLRSKGLSAPYDDEGKIRKALGK